MNHSEYNPPYKKIFNLKPKQRDGLILNIYETIDKKTTALRFLFTCFNRNNQYLASSDNNGNIYLIDFNNYKYWRLTQSYQNYVYIKFSLHTDSDLFISMKNGSIHIIDVENGITNGNLIGHTHYVEFITFATNFLCLTASKYEAIVWDLRTHTKNHVLSLKKNTCLKFASFIPTSTSILTCFNDDTIQIWNYNKFDSLIEIGPGTWNCRPVKHIGFAKNGQIMVLALHPVSLAVFLIKTWKLIRLITLPENILSIKSLEFLSNLCDEILAILTGNGTIYFYDLENNSIINQLTATNEIIRFNLSTNYISTVLCSGDVVVYDLMEFVMKPMESRTEITRPNKRLHERKERNQKRADLVKEKINDMLNVSKLRLILQQFGEFPENYRTTIWEHLLQLPQNYQQYNNVINCRQIQSFQNLHELYPLEDKGSLRNLRRLLDNLVTWSKFFAHVEYLPVFVFPFVKIFQNKPLICFEAICTIIVNWCQYWFEYFPLPPVNILAIIENLLLEHDPILLNHLIRYKISTHVYAWPLLETVFSQALTTPQWKQFWDHILINHPSFLLCAVVAYNISQRSILLSFHDMKMFNCFYKDHQLIDINRLIKRTYQIYNKTLPDDHPKQYLHEFKKLSIGNYPKFSNYPKTVIDYQKNEQDSFNDDIKWLQRQEIELVKQRMENLKKLHDFEMEQEEKRRLLEMEKAIKSKLLKEHKIIEEYANSVTQLRKRIEDEKTEIVELTQRAIKQDRENRRNAFELDQMFTNKQNRSETVEIVQDLVNHLSELCRIKTEINKNPQENINGSICKEIQQRLTHEINRIRGMTNSTKHLEVFTISTGLEAIDLLMQKINDELEKIRQRKCKGNEISSCKDICLKIQTEELITRINNILRLLSQIQTKN